MAKNRNRQSRQDKFEEATGTKPMRSKSVRIKAKETAARAEAKPLVARSDRQKEYLAAIRSSPVTIALGPAGTGKTYVCTKFAAQALDNGEYKHLLVIRPPVESGPSLGALPGDEKEKTDPYTTPFLSVLREHYGASAVEAKMGGNQPSIEFQVPQFIRGDTWTDTFVVLDEAQNMTQLQMKTFLTRVGENCKVVINGDITQQDIRGRSGLHDLAVLFPEDNDWIKRVTFTADDVVRSGFVKYVLKCYEENHHSLRD